MTATHPTRNCPLVNLQGISSFLLRPKMLNQVFENAHFKPSYGITHNVEHGDTHLQDNGRPRNTISMEYKDRIKAARKHASLTQVGLAERVGIDQTSVSDLERGKSASSSYGASIAAACGVSALWLEKGVGEMLGSAKEAGSGPDENGSPSKKDYALIPQYTARASAGNGYHNDHIEMTEGLVFKRDWLRRLSLKEEHLCIIYADGNSMEPTISEGDVLLIDRASTQPVSGKVYAIQRPDGSHSIKRLVQSFAGDWTIVSDNQDKRAYPDEPISADALEQIHIIGRSVWSGGGM